MSLISKKWFEEAEKVSKPGIKALERSLNLKNFYVF